MLKLRAAVEPIKRKLGGRLAADRLKDRAYKLSPLVLICIGARKGMGGGLAV